MRGKKFSCPRMCLKIAFCQLCITVCGRFVPNEGGVVGYVDRMRDKSPAKWGVQMVGMNFKTHSSTTAIFRLKMCCLKTIHYLLRKQRNIFILTILTEPNGKHILLKIYAFADVKKCMYMIKGG
ncbi:hypothetical protein C823_000263 [Eubacterium plexicaudatum ASF492]|uniref:Uncharacterized protein n=1 Tax=Eubacterium plexicaudatum ASF492 TaxID=1235802 RepID=N2A6L7_9FIRM|nr:hypothetical protein C823_000263 [Eubacterium plexicaudatum ASF492]